MILKQKFYEGGPTFMGFLTIVLIVLTAWFIYQFVVAYRSKLANPEKSLRMLGYGKTLGLFAMITGFLGQLIGLTAMFDAMELAAGAGKEIQPVFGIWGYKSYHDLFHLRDINLPVFDFVVVCFNFNY